MRRLLPLILILAGCGSTPEPSPAPAIHPTSTSGDSEPVAERPPPPLGAQLAQWWDAPEPASCTVHVTHGSGEDALEAIRYFEGRQQVSGTSHPQVDSDGQSRLSYADGRPARIDYQLAQAAESLPCASEEGCDTPALRTRGAVELDYDEQGQLVSQVNRSVVHALDGETWRAVREHEDTFQYTYDHEGQRTGFRVALHGSAVASGTLHHEDGRLVAQDMQRGDFRVNRTFQYDAGGRVVSRTRVTCRTECSDPNTTEFDYDEAGHIVHSRSPGRTVHYTYDADGRLTSQDEGRPIRYRYEEGRLVEIVRSPTGQGSTTYRYEGECDGVDLSPRAPSAYEGSELEVCVSDPVYAVEPCIPVN